MSFFFWCLLIPVIASAVGWHLGGPRLALSFAAGALVFGFGMLVRAWWLRRTQGGEYVREMTYCPYCDELISVNAIRCPHCRSNLEEDDEDYEEDEGWEDDYEDEEEEEEERPRKRRRSRRRHIKSGYDPELDAWIDVSETFPKRRRK